MGINAVRQFQERPQPLFPPPTKQGYVRPIVGPADGAQMPMAIMSQQLVPLAPLNPRVI